MLHKPKVRSLKRSLLGIFGVSKPNITFLNHKDLYYKAYWLTKNLSDGIELVAAMERTSKVRAANLLVAKGLSHYMRDKLDEFIKSECERVPIRGRNRPRSSQILIRYAREHGMDISKLA